MQIVSCESIFQLSIFFWKYNECKYYNFWSDFFFLQQDNRIRRIYFIFLR